MKVVDMHNEKLNACFSFTKGSCLISVSTIMNKNRAEIAIFCKDTDNLLKDRLNTVEEAITWVNNFGPRD